MACPVCLLLVQQIRCSSLQPAVYTQVQVSGLGAASCPLRALQTDKSWAETSPHSACNSQTQPEAVVQDGVHCH
jgi:hypothetical protein